ncbi:MAG: fibronectin type III domain-containing protein [Nitrospinae bacterium]|nr:fibronectin type III domain-containing protein [Nitrospinota bacterium]
MNWDFKKTVFFAVVLGFLACGNNNSGVVTGITAMPGNGQVTLSWNLVNGATSYNVYYSTNPNVAPTATSNQTGTLSQKGLTNLSTTITGLTNGTLWYFVVTAVTTNGESAPSTTVSATPTSTSTGTSGSGAVTGVTATKVGTGQVLVSWGPVSGAISYNVYYDTTPNVNTSSPVVQNITGTSTTISGLASGVTYYFIVTVNTAPPSTPVSVPL